MSSAQEHFHEVLRENEELKARILELEAELAKKSEREELRVDMDGTWDTQTR